MRISREAKIGISSIIILFIAYWGITFLKGSNLLSSVNIYKTSYSDVGGLEMSSPVIINGMKVGTVIRVEMSDVEGDVYVDFTVKSKYKIPDNSVAVLGSASLLSGKSIELITGDSKELLKNGGTMKSRINNGMMDAVTDISERASNLIDSLTLTLSKINSLLSDKMINDAQGTVANLKSSTATLDKMLTDEKGKISKITTNLGQLTGDLNEIMPEVKGAVKGFNTLTQSLNGSLPHILAQIDEIVAKINSNKGTVGKLLTSSDLYDGATITFEEAAALLRDLKQNPKRYVHFSLFGKKEKKK